MLGAEQLKKGVTHMHLAFCIPTGMRHRCFAPTDVQLLREHKVVFSGSENEDGLRDEWPSLVKNAEVVVTGWHTPVISDAMLDQAEHLRFIAHAAGSIKHLFPRSIFERGIRVATANSALAIGVAESTLGMIIGGVKGFDRCAQLTRAGGWKVNDTDTPGFQIRELFGITIGLIGLGQVGRRLAKMLRAFEVQVIAYDPHASQEDVASLGVTLVSLSQLMSQSDVVSLHAPALPETFRMLSAPQFSAMKSGAIFINTSRGSIVDEDALIAELRTGRIHAILDVTDPEPPRVTHPFRTLPNVMLTPHISGAISNGCLRQGRCSVAQILAYAAGQKVPGEVTGETLAIMA